MTPTILAIGTACVWRGERGQDSFWRLFSSQRCGASGFGLVDLQGSRFGGRCGIAPFSPLIAVAQANFQNGQVSVTLAYDRFLRSKDHRSQQALKLSRHKLMTHRYDELY